MSEKSGTTIRKIPGEPLKYLTYCVAFLPCVPYLINSITIIFWSVCAVLNKVLSTRHDMKNQRSSFFFLLFSGNYLIALLSLIYTVDLKEGLTNLTTQLPGLLFPLIFFLLPFPLKLTSDLMVKILNIFLISTLLMCVWVLFHYRLIYQWEDLKIENSFNTAFREIANKVTGKHPTYLSLFTSFSIAVAARNFLTTNAVLIKIVNTIAICFLMCVLLLFASRTPIAATFTGLLIFIMLQIKKGHLRFVVFIIFVFCAFLFIRFTPSVYSRFQETINTSWNVPQGLEFNSTNIRAGIFACTFELISRRPLVGYGMGSDKKVLNNCYEKFPTEAYKLTFYNTHNQYLNFWLLTGAAGVVIFILSLSYAFYVAVKTKTWLFVYFLIIVSTAFFTENILSRQAGVVFYYFFLCFFLSFLKAESKTIDEGTAKKPVSKH